MSIDKSTEEETQEDVVHMATHELKAPVTVLKAYLQLAAMKMKVTEPAVKNQTEGLLEDFAELSGKMNLQLEKLVNLINDLSESSRIKSGSLTYQMKPFDIISCIKDCIAGFQAAYPKAEITYRISGSGLMLNGDESRLEQVLLNLLSNAVKYSEGVPKILVDCERKDENVLIQVSDQGLGIPESFHTSVFERFFRVDSPEMKKFPGLGLGLYICAKIIKFHNGEIGVKSSLNEGSTFWFSIPLHK